MYDTALLVVVDDAMLVELREVALIERDVNPGSLVGLKLLNSGLVFPRGDLLGYRVHPERLLVWMVGQIPDDSSPTRILQQMKRRVFGERLCHTTVLQ